MPSHQKLTMANLEQSLKPVFLLLHENLQRTQCGPQQLFSFVAKQMVEKLPKWVLCEVKIKKSS